MEPEQLAKSHEIVWSVMEFYQFCPWIFTRFLFFVTTNELSSNLESLHTHIPLKKSGFGFKIMVRLMNE